jgi:hypothetical protein
MTASDRQNKKARSNRERQEVGVGDSLNWHFDSRLGLYHSRVAEWSVDDHPGPFATEAARISSRLSF